METHNRDVFPPVAAQGLYAAVRPLIANPIIDDLFSKHEEAALRAKASYHSRGRLGMLLVVASTLFTIAEALFHPALPEPALVGVCMILTGVCGISIQLHLLFAQRKRDWLINRFAAERLRSIKFQAYPLAETALDLEDLAHKADEFYRAESARLQLELNAGEAALTLFSPISAVRRMSSPPKEANPAIGETARNAYRELRIDYQRRFATAEIALLKGKQRIRYTSADFLYLAGAAFIIGALVLRVVAPDTKSVHDLSKWIDFLAVSAFVIGLAKTILDNASLAETSQGRYEQYVQMLTECDRELTAEAPSFSEIVRGIERTALDELSQFCQSAARISYRL